MAFSFSLDDAVAAAQKKEDDTFEEAIGQILLNLSDHAEDKTVSRAFRKVFFTGMVNLTGYPISQLIGLFQSGKLEQSGATPPQNALGAGSTPKPSGPSQEEYDQVVAKLGQAEADRNNYAEVVRGLTDGGAGAAFVLEDPRQRKGFVKQVIDRLAYASAEPPQQSRQQQAPAGVSQADHNAVVAERDRLKEDLRKAKEDLSKIASAATMLDELPFEVIKPSPKNATKKGALYDETRAVALGNGIRAIRQAVQSHLPQRQS